MTVNDFDVSVKFYMVVLGFKETLSLLEVNKQGTMLDEVNSSSLSY